MKLIKSGLEIFNGNLPEYGGHSRKLSKITGLDYLIINFGFGFGYHHYYYDGQHHIILLGIAAISWGGKPFFDLEE